jgi:uncharacterized protein (DUF2384 family)
MDPHLSALLLRSVVEAQDAALVEPNRAALRVALEGIRHALSELVAGEPVADERPAADVARWLAEVIDAPQEEIASLLGVGVRTFQRWISPTQASSPSGEDARRLRVVARLVAQLRFALGGLGALRWFEWPRSDLDGRSPRDLLVEARAVPQLMRAASAMRTSDAV